MATIDPYLFTLDPERTDEALGFRVSEIETELLSLAKKLDPLGSHKTWGHALHQGNQTWVGLSHQTLQTPYTELKQICDELNLKDQWTVVDLGAGYGRMGLVISTFYPEVYFLGFEYVAERVTEGTRIFKKYDCQNAQLIKQDLTSSEFRLPEAEIYFLYDYGTVLHIRETLKQLEKLAETRNFKIVARGKGVRSLIQYEHPWLASVYPVIHQENYSIYSMSEDL